MRDFLPKKIKRKEIIRTIIRKIWIRANVNVDFGQQLVSDTWTRCVVVHVGDLRLYVGVVGLARYSLRSFFFFFLIVSMKLMKKIGVAPME